jgi:hypothetical protein
MRRFSFQYYCLVGLVGFEHLCETTDITWDTTSCVPNAGDSERHRPQGRGDSGCLWYVDGSDSPTLVVNRPPDANRVGEAQDVALSDGGTALTSVAASSQALSCGVVDLCLLPVPWLQALVRYRAAGHQRAHSGPDQRHDGDDHDDQVAAHALLVAIDIRDRYRQQHDAAVDVVQRLVGPQLED